MVLTSAPSLCPVVQGVVFEFTAGGRPAKAVVLSEVLEERFGATPDKATWIPCFQRHRHELLACAVQAFQRTQDASVVLVRARDLDALPARPVSAAVLR